MLVLSRKEGESIMIDDDIEIHVIKVQGLRVRIGIKAPLHNRIVRQEIYFQNQTNHERGHDNGEGQEPQNGEHAR